jgi:hypothetical protein
VPKKFQGAGRFFIDMSTSETLTSDLYLSQTITTMPGQTYHLDIVLYQGGANADTVDVVWGDVVIARIASDAANTVTRYHGYAAPLVTDVLNADGTLSGFKNFSFIVMGNKDDAVTRFALAGDQRVAGGQNRELLSINLRPTVSDGNVTLIGGVGSDILFGQGGDDVLVGAVQSNPAADAGAVDVAVMSFVNTNGNDTFQDFEVGVDRVYLVDVVDAYVGSGNWASSGNSLHVSRFPGNPGSTNINATSNGDNNLTLRDLVFANDSGTALSAIGQNKQYITLTANASGDLVIHLNTNGGTTGATNDNMGSITLTGVKYGSGAGQYDSVADLLGQGGSTRIIWATTDGFKDPISTTTFGGQTIQDFDWMKLININGPLFP